MPELPEVETVVNELNKKLKNRIIKSVKVNAPKMVAVGPATISNRRKVKNYQVIKFIKLLQGQRVLSVARRSKLIIFNLSPSTPARGSAKDKLKIIIHLKMTGQFIFEDKVLKAKTLGSYRLLNKLTAPLVKLPSKHTHVVFNFTDGSTLYFNDIRKFGYLKLVTTEEFNQLKELKEYGPEPLDKKFTLLTFRVRTQNVNRRKISVKQLLMDNSFVVGIGNIYSDEILFHSGISPRTSVSEIPDSGWTAVYKNIKMVLTKAVKAKGSSVGDFIRTDGSWGQMGKYHFVYGRKGQKCKNCGTIIETVKLGGRTASYCPKCQK